MFDNMDEIARYKKKRKSSTSKSSEKSKHKHTAKDVLLIDENKRPRKAIICDICGKINNVYFSETERLESGCYRMLSDDEVFEKYKHLEKIPIRNIFDKYVPLTSSDRKDE